MSTSSLPWIDRVSRRWWFFLILLVLFFFPAYTSQSFNPAETPQLVIEVLSNPVAYTAPVLFPLFKLVPAVLIAGLVLAPRRFSRWFYTWVGVHLIAIAVFQDMGVTESYGFAVLIGNLLIYALIGLFWLRAARGPNGAKLNLARPLPFWRYWVILPALFAFWYPVSTAAGIPSPNFAPLRLVINEAGLTFCMMLPVYLAVLILNVPRVDKTLLRVSGFVGAFTGLLNVVEFLLIPMYGPWMAALHLPLLILSGYAFILSFRW